jgi:hypothetical protein
MTIKDFITKEELKETMNLARHIRKKFGTDEYILFKKLATVAALQGGWNGYVNYGYFLRNTNYVLSNNRSPYDILHFKYKLMYKTKIYNTNPTDIVNKSYQDLFADLYERREIYFMTHDKA